MNGSHPSVSDGEVSRMACANVPGGRPIGCTYSYTIKVLNCGDFYVYKLKPPKHCYLAYCIGKPCFDDCHSISIVIVLVLS